jgi:hypothetical protein
MQRIATAALVWFGVAVALGPASAQSYRTMPYPGPPPLSESECTAAPVDPAHLFIVAGVMEADTLTNLQLENPNSSSTVVRVTVNPGKRRLTVLLQSETAVIWDFEGATQRVQRAFVSAPNRQAAVRGLPMERIEFRELARCRQKILPPWIVSVEERDRALATYFGRVADRIAFEGEPNSFVLPDAAFATTPRGVHRRDGIQPTRDGWSTLIGNIKRIVKDIRLKEPPPDAPETFNQLRERIHNEKCARADPEDDLFFYHPGGFRQIDAGSLISPVPVLAPESFPGEAGLIQLKRAGAIRPACRSEIDAFIEGASRPYRSERPDYRLRVSADYVVTRDMMFPAALHGAHLKNFLVLSGVPAPRGDAGHGCVMFMDGFRMNGAHCPRSGP